MSRRGTLPSTVLLLTIVCACSDSCPPAPQVAAVIDVATITGYWRGDDNAIYAIRGVSSTDISQGLGTVFWAGLNDDGGLYKGIGFSNVFVGAVKAGDTGPVTIVGTWSDVPRGVNWGSGSLVLTIGVGGHTLDANPPFGVFGAKHWARMQAPANPDDIDAVMNRVHKNHYNIAGPAGHNEVLGQNDNLTPMRDHTVVSGTVAPVSSNTGELFGWSAEVGVLPPNGYTYSTFCTHPANDGDVDLDVLIDAQSVLPRFWQIGWDPHYKDLHLQDARRRFDSNGAFHTEIIMFGADGNCDNADSAQESTAELPGWAEMGSNAVLINGRPVAQWIVADGAHDVLIGGLDFSVDPPPEGQVPRHVRVTGLVSLDCGHDTLEWKGPIPIPIIGPYCGTGIPPTPAWQPPGTPSDAAPIGLEIHPVYAIDMYQPPTEDLSGAWDDGLEHTFYIRVLENKIWVLGMGPFRDNSFGLVGMGTRTGSTIDLDWADVPLGTGMGSDIHTSIVVQSGNGVLTFTSGPLAPLVLTKLYGACPTGTTCHDVGAQCGPVLASCGASVFCGYCTGGLVCGDDSKCSPPPPTKTPICLPATPGQDCTKGTLPWGCNEKEFCCLNGPGHCVGEQQDREEHPRHLHKSAKPERRVAPKGLSKVPN